MGPARLGEIVKNERFLHAGNPLYRRRCQSGQKGSIKTSEESAAAGLQQTGQGETGQVAFATSLCFQPETRVCQCAQRLGAKNWAGEKLTRWGQSEAPGMWSKTQGGVGTGQSLGLPKEPQCHRMQGRGVTTLQPHCSLLTGSVDQPLGHLGAHKRQGVPTRGGRPEI